MNNPLFTRTVSLEYTIYTASLQFLQIYQIPTYQVGFINLKIWAPQDLLISQIQSFNVLIMSHEHE